MKTIVVLVLLTVLTGCGPIVKILHQDKYKSNCDSQCYAECNEKVPPITANPDSARFSLELSEVYRGVCGQRRKACAECIQRAKDAGAIE